MNKQTNIRISFRQKIILITFGLFLFIVLFEIGSRLSGFILLSLQEHSNLKSIKQKGAYRVMCLGESTTQGQYSLLLEEILNQRNIGIKFSVIDKGVAGTDTGVIVSKIEANLINYQPDLVVAMMGINDAGLYVSQERVSTSKITLFYKSLRIYKFIRFLSLHLITKAKEAGFYSLKEYNRAVQRLRHEPQEYGLALADILPDYVIKQKGIPKKTQAYLKLGWYYKNQARFPEAEQAFTEAIILNPGDYQAYLELGRLYREQTKFPEAEQVFIKVLMLGSRDYLGYLDLGGFFQQQGKFTEAEQSFKKAIELNPIGDRAGHVRLGELYMAQGEFTEAEQVLKQAIKWNPGNEMAYGGLATMYSKIGNRMLFEEYWDKTRRILLGYYNPMTIKNYHRLKRILDKRKVRLACVQYPVRSVEPLKIIFQGEGGVIFVDNERGFKEALRKGSYKEYFNDMFAGDFGHCTYKGNRLLAENIANTILKEVFNK